MQLSASDGVPTRIVVCRQRYLCALRVSVVKKQVTTEPKSLATGVARDTQCGDGRPRPSCLSEKP
jgi:hypothetical protein